MGRWRCPELVGREPERAALRGAWARAVAGRPGVVVVRGEPGMGKSRLMEALVAHASSTPAPSPRAPIALIGACAPLVGELVPLAPIRHAFQSLSIDKADSTVFVEPLIDALQPIEQVDGTTSREAGQMLERLRTGLWTLPGEQPTLLVIEDIHWADPSTVALLAYSIARSEFAPSTSRCTSSSA